MLRRRLVALTAAASLSLAACAGSSDPVPVDGAVSTGEDRPSDGTVGGTTPGRQAVLELERVAEVSEPVDATSRVGDPAVYLVSRGGRVLRLAGGTVAGDPVLDIGDLTEGDGERGLLGLAFSPDGRVAYVNYTDRSGDTIVASVAVDADGLFDRGSLRTLLVIEQPYRNHNGGDLVVEPSGTVLVATGDGGSADDPLRVALDEASPLGKVLRIDPSSGSVDVVAKGLRNPWRIDLHDDRLWLADVGQNRWEEVSVLDRVSGVTEPVDFGWSAWEANERFNEDQSSPAHVPPVVAYRHGDDGCSISGGAVATSGSLAGHYVFADYCSGRVWSIPTDEPSPAMVPRFTGVDSPVAVVRANDQVYVLSLSGTVWRIVG
jgi:glucose/arabinose dehydrogenase